MLLFLNLWRSFTKFLNKVLLFFGLFFIGFYQRFLSGTLGMGGCCRFYPSCSDYALEVYQKEKSFAKGSLLVCKRLLSCHPLYPWLNKYERSKFFR